jgi:hypothetical protein
MLLSPELIQPSEGRRRLGPVTGEPVIPAERPEHEREIPSDAIRLLGLERRRASGGVIGGQQQSGTWGIDARYNAPELVRRIERVAEFRDRIT